MPEIPQVHLWGAGALVYQCQDEEILMVGGAGTGKTIGAMKKLVDACLGYPGSRHLLCRQTRASMTDSILPTLESVIGVDHPEVLRVSREQRHSYRLNGGEIVCAGLDEPTKSYGTAWGIVVLEEAIEASLAAWELFGRSARDPRLAGTGMPSFPYHQRIAITNPGAPDHWLHERAEKCPDAMLTVNTRRDHATLYAFSGGRQTGKMRRILATHQDNPSLFHAPSWSWTPAGVKYLASLDSMSGHRRAWMRQGLWRMPAGTVFPEYDPIIHDVDDFEPPHEWPMVQACDPGFGTTSWLWFAMAPDGGIFVFDEIYEGGRAFTLHCEEANRRNRKHERPILRSFGDPNEMFSFTSQGASCASQAMKLGIRFTPWPRDAGAVFEGGIEKVRNFLLASNTVKPHYLRICKRCKGLRSNLSSWSFAKNRHGEVVEGADRYEKGNDHSADCLRGALQSNYLQHLFAAGIAE